MQLEQQIESAIEAHSEWKRRLNSAIDTGQSAHSVAVVCRDDRCALGQWLHSLDGSTKDSFRWQCVRTTHAEFHAEAAQVLELALAGKKRDARARITYSSSFTGLSNKLTAELTAWKRESIGQLAAHSTVLGFRG